MAHNIVSIIADDHRASAMERCGSETVATPNLDHLAADGCHLRQLRIEGGRCRAVCIPTRASMITGCSVATACEDSEGRVLKPESPMLPEELRHRGYHCEIIGKWHQDIASLRRGFDHGRMLFTGGMGDHRALPVHEWSDLEKDPLPSPYRLEQYSNDAFRDAAIRFIRERSQRSDQPFYLQVGLTLPHDPFDPPPGWVDPPDDQLPPLPPDFQSEHPFEIGDMDVRDEQLLPWPRPPLDVRRMAARYYAMIGAIDDLVGRVRTALAESGLAGNTLFFYTGDHGLCGGRHGLLGKQNLYDASLRIPGLLCGPGISAGSTVDALASQLDLAPTLLDLAGCGPSVFDKMEGHSLAKAIKVGGDERKRRYHFARYRHYQRSVTDGVYKLIATRVGDDLRLQLFDLVEDPDESRNLAADPVHHARLEKLASALNEYLDRGGDPDFARICQS